MMKKVLYILGELEDADVDWMSKNGPRDTMHAGEVLITQGVPHDSLCFVLDGEFSVTVDGIDVATVSAGEVLGEISFVDDHPPTATVTAIASARVLSIPREAMQRKLATDAGFAARFYRAISVFLADRLRGTLQTLSGKEPAPGLDELDLDRLDRVSRAGERFERVLRTLAT